MSHHMQTACRELLHFGQESNRHPKLDVDAGRPSRAIAAFLRDHSFPELIRETWHHGRNLVTRVHDYAIASALQDYLTTPTRLRNAVLVTGDLATTGHPEDLMSARNFFSGYIADQSASPLIGGGHPAAIKDTTSVFLLPGNHDRFRPRLLLFPGCRNFETHFGPAWDLGRDKGSRIGKRVVSFHIEGKTDTLAICCADLSLKGFTHSASVRGMKGGFVGLIGQAVRGIWGRGRAYSGTVRTLRDYSQECRKEGKAVVWAIHFPPSFGPPFGIDREELALLGEELVIDAALGAGIKLIFAGHQHVSAVYPIRNTGITICCAGTATSYGSEDNSFFDFEIEVDGGQRTDRIQAQN